MKRSIVSWSWWREHPHRLLFAILGVALLARLVLIMQMGPHYYFGDTAEYEKVAKDFMAGRGFQADVPRAPLYPLFMAAGFLLGGQGNYMAVRLLQVVFGLSIVVLCYVLGRRIAGQGVGLIAALGAALAPTLVFTTALLYPTVLRTLCVLAATLACVWMVRHPSLASAVLLGLALAAGWYTNPAFAVQGAALVCGLVLVAWRRRGALPRTAAGAIAIAVIACAPSLWIASSGKGEVFMAKAQYVMHVARSDPAFGPDRLVRIAPDTPFAPLGTGAFVRREWELMRTQPVAYLHDYVDELVHFFAPVPDRLQTSNVYTRPVVKAVAAIYFVPVLGFGLYGLWRGRARRCDRIFLLLPIVATAAFYAMFFTQTRYRVSIEPLLIVAAGLGLQRAFPRALAATEGAGAARRPRGAPVAVGPALH
jgi:4-amino-4-deoxy-L-arabinose transferase-like glycosyltransferase